MKTITVNILMLISLSLHSQVWETIMAEYTYVYDISNHEDKLLLVGLHDNNFVFSSSVDNGETWTEQILNDYITVNLGIPIAVGFFNANDGIIGIKGNFDKEYLISHDGGLTWENFIPDVKDNCTYIPQPWKINIVNDSTAVIQQFQSGNFIISYDNAVQWDCIYSFGTSSLPNFTILNSNSYLNYDRNGIYQSYDKGQSWNIIFEAQDLSTYNMLDDQIGFAVSAYYTDPNGNPTLYTTNDSWASVESNLLPELNDKIVNAVVPISSEELFFFERQNIHYSDDGGQSISLIQQIDFEPTSVKNINGEWYVTGRGLAKYNPNGTVNTSDVLTTNEKPFLFPNPVSNSIIEINSNNYSNYQLFNLSGQLVEHGFISNGKILLNQVSHGLHILYINNKSQTNPSTFKIFIE